MAGTKSITLAVILAVHGLATASASGHSGNIHWGAPVEANMLPRLAHPVQAREASPSVTLPVSSSLTTVQVPIATVCSMNGTPGTSDAFSAVLSPTVTSSNGTNSIVSASAMMPDGSMTTFASRARRQDAALDAQLAATITLPGGLMAMPLLGGQSEAGQLVIGSDGCQTLYSPTTTAICSTVVSPAGLPPVTITDCDQYITFSSETLFSCSQTPTYSTKPYTTTPASAETVTLDDGTLTSLPFEKAGSTSTMGGASNDEMASITSPTDSTVTDLAPVGDVDQEEDDPLEKRQVMFDRNEKKPIMTDLKVVAPSGTPKLQKRQAKFHEKNNKPYPGRPHPGKGRVHHENNWPYPPNNRPHYQNSRPATTNSSVTDPTTTSSIDVEAPVTASGYTTGLPIRTSNGTTAGVFAAATAATNIMPVPAMLQARYNRQRAVQHHHRRQADRDTSKSDMPTVSMPSLPINTIDASTTAHDTNSTLALQNKLAHLSPPQPTRYYAAPWTEIAQGGVPTHVKGITCYGGLPPAGECTTPDTDGDTEPCECAVQNEIWSVTTLAETRVGTTIASFDGPVVVTIAGTTRTTSINFTSTVTTTRTYESVLVVHSTLAAGEAVSVEPTVTVAQTSIPSATMTLLPGDDASAGVFAGMPQDAPASTSDTPTDDAYYGSATTVPGADDLPTTVFQTSVVATETVTVAGADSSAAPA